MPFEFPDYYKRLATTEEEAKGPGHPLPMMDRADRMQTLGAYGGVPTQPRPTAPVDRQPAVHVELAELGGRLGALYETVERLEQRLGVVLRPVPAAAGSNAAEAPRAALPALAEALRAEVRRVTSIDGHLHEIIDRIEV